MNKFKNAYCRVTVIFAVIVIIFAVMLLKSQDIYATGTVNNPPLDYDEAVNDIDVPSGDAIGEPEDQRNRPLPSATSDSTNGISFSYNNEEGNLSGSIRILLVLDSCSFAVYIDYADVVYQNYNCSAFFKDGDWYADSSAKSDFDWSCIIFDIIYYAASVFRN